jgi:hypothetical protein
VLDSHLLVLSRSGVASCLACGEHGGMGGTEVGTVADEHSDPLLPRLGQVHGDQVCGVRFATAGHPDVGRRCTGVLTDHHVGGRDGVTLDAVRGAGVGKLHVRRDVVGRQ